MAAPIASPAPSATPGLRLTLDAFSSYVDQAAAGPGIVPPEGAGFASGSPLSPMTPYDTFSSAPNTPGVGGVSQALLTGVLTGTKLAASATLGLGYVDGSIQNAAYWTENLLPAYNPHLGSQALPYAIAFPTHAGQDDASALRLSLLSASLSRPDGSLALKGGWFDLTQSDRFVFEQAPLTNVTPAIGLQTPESLGDGPPALDAWPSPPPGLPLDGVDLVARKNSTTIELTDALLPALPGTTARLAMISAVADHGVGTRFSAQVARLVTGGALISTSTMFGADATTQPGPQGPLPISVLGAQRQTIAGVRGAFHVAPRLDGLVEIGRAWYDADHVLRPGTTKPGGFYHAALSRTTKRSSVSVEFFRFEPRYATAILPYGAPENVWSVAWSWPGPWLKSNYQLVDNSALGVNRQGFRFKYAVESPNFQLRVAAATYRQIELATLGNVTQVGFVDGFFLPQNDDAATRGVQHQYALWSAWRRPFGDLTFDYVEDTQHRDFVAAHPEDAVSYAAPQYVLTYSRALTKHAIVAGGIGRYGMRGSWGFGGITNVDFAQHVEFIGTQLAESPRAALLVQVRWTAFDGLPSIAKSSAPDYHGALVVIENRYHI